MPALKDRVDKVPLESFKTKQSSPVRDQGEFGVRHEKTMIVDLRGGKHVGCPLPVELSLEEWQGLQKLCSAIDVPVESTELGVADSLKLSQTLKRLTRILNLINENRGLTFRRHVKVG